MKNEIKWAWQRVVRGYDDRLFWSMSEYLDPMVVAVAKRLREDGVGYPTGLTVKKWNRVLDLIIKGLSPEPESIKRGAFKKYYKDRLKAQALLAMYWDSLWD